MIKLLAKLRQYGGGDVAEYLKTEHRQNLLALENALNKVQAVAGSVSNQTIESGAEVFRASFQGSFSGTVSLSTNSIYAGSLVSNVYYPPEDAEYWIEFSCACDHYLSGPSNALTTTLSAVTTGSIGSGSNVTYPVGGLNAVTQAMPTVVVKASLTVAVGVYFSASVPSGAVASRFYCKITKA